MPFPVLGSNSAVAGYEIDNSLRFNDGDSAKLGKDFSTTETSDKTKTLSFWIKRSTLGQEGLIRARTDSEDENTRTIIYFASNDSLQVQSRVGGSGATLSTNRLFRDISAWYHLVFAFDTSQGTASNRLKIYVNGAEETSFAVDERSSISQNREIQFGNNKSSAESFIGNEVSDLGFYDGYISEFNFIDGQQLDASYFGETNDNGVWIPKEYDGSYGTNGFKLQFQDSGNLGDDTSGNGNDFTATNLTATDQTTDTPTNNFATMNPLSSSAYEGSYTFAEGNTEMHWTAHATALSTIGVSSGKWYVEVKKITSTGSHNGGIVFEKNGNVGTLIEPVASEQSACGVFPLTATGELYYNQTQQQSDASWTFAVGDILQYYIDLDNGTLKVKKNGSDFSTAFSITLSNSNDYSSGATTFFAVGYNGDDIQVNFGNPAFSISSSNSDPNGYGSFEYSTNDGTYDYYALCTKNLAEYG
jgi:predicted enzyme related to lactoylglutathione lyase